MCVICGIIFKEPDRTPSTQQVEAMAETLRHRGPDGGGVHISGRVGLGHRRLKIIDLSEDGRQPMSNEDGSIWVTFNGEIYNFRELRRELEAKGHRFRSQTDTEVIVHSYEEWGLDCLHRFNGMFAFGLWDENQKQLHLVRDRLGIKPLFYAPLPDRLLFGSEIKAILADPDFPAELNPAGLHHYLSLNYTPAPLTLFRNISQLLPGESLTFASGKIEKKCYWDLEYPESPEDLGEAHYLEELDRIFEKSVTRRLVSDVPFGAFLSGGVDSSAIVAYMTRVLEQPVKTFSIGFEENSYSELPYARQVAKELGTEHYEEVIRPDNVADLLPKLVWHAEEPTADSSMLPLWHVSHLARRNVTMVLSGDGGDEICAGYETYSASHAAELYRRIPNSIRSNVIRPLVEALPVSHQKVSFDTKAKRFVAGASLDEPAAFFSWRMIFDEAAKRGLYLSGLRDNTQNLDSADLYRDIFHGLGNISSLSKMLYTDTRFYLPNDMLVKVDRMTMACGLEARVPFLDHELVEFMARVPDHYKLKGLTGKKHLIKRLLKGKVNDQVWKRKKAGFNIPVGTWIKTSLRSYVQDALLASDFSDCGWFNKQAIEHLINDHLADKVDNSHRIWSLLVLQEWRKRFSVT